jgi:tetratricopeptide (TPR) repeat protein
LRRGRARLLVAAGAVLALAACSSRPGTAARPGAAERPGVALASANERAGLGDAAGALAGYRAARDRDPRDVRAHLAYVRAQVDTGRRSQARDEYVERARRPDATEVDRTLAARLASDGASSTLRRIYAGAAGREPGVPWWPLALAEVELAEADAWNQRRLKAIDQGDRAAETKAFAQARGALARADRELAKLAGLSPALPETDVYLGHLRALEGDLHAGAGARQAAYRASLAAFERAVRADPGSLEAWSGLADVQGRVGEQGESLRSWLEVARRAPADAEARRSVATLLHQVGRPRDAVEQYRVLASLRPTEAEPWLLMGDALAELESWEEALAAYDQALARDGTVLEAHARKGAIYEHRGRLAEAQAAYQRYIDQDGPRKAEIERRLERMLRAPARR